MELSEGCPTCRGDSGHLGWILVSREMANGHSAEWVLEPCPDCNLDGRTAVDLRAEKVAMSQERARREREELLGPRATVRDEPIERALPYADK